MPKNKPSLSSTQPPAFCFAEQLLGENPASFAAMKALYEQAVHLLVLQPWDLLNETQLIVVRQPGYESDCYCSVMGSSGQVFSIYVYLGSDSYAMFRKIITAADLAPADFFAGVHSVYVEFVPKHELETPDRALLTPLGHHPRRGELIPMFRAIRPGYHPWFITAEEARLLSVCLQAMTLVCLEIRNTGAHKYWTQPGIFPLFITNADFWRVEPIKPATPAERALRPARLAPEELARLRKQGYPIRGVIELDYFAHMMAVGGKNERKACSAVALAVDAKSGFVFSPAVTSPPDPGESLVKAISSAMTVCQALPAEIHVRSKKVKNCISTVAKTLDVPLRIVPQLPAFDEAREGLLDAIDR